MESADELRTWHDEQHPNSVAREEAELRVAARKNSPFKDEETHAKALASARRNVARFIGNASVLTTPEVVLPPLPEDPSAAT